MRLFLRGYNNGMLRVGLAERIVVSPLKCFLFPPVGLNLDLFSCLSIDFVLEQAPLGRL